MQKSQHSKENRFDYSKYSSTGEKVKVQQKSISSDMATSVQLQESLIADEISDVMEDNSPETICESIDLLTSCKDRIESLRVRYRIKHQEIKNSMSLEDYENKYDKSFISVLTNIRNYIRTLNRFIQKNHCRDNQSSQEVNAHNYNH